MKALYKLTIFISVLMLASCQDFMNVGSDNVITTDKDHLNSRVDSVYSVIGIINKLQKIADRTILLGEVRGDLVDINSNTNKNLQELSKFEISDDNPYNNPADYYAVINNCNYFLANADPNLQNNRKEYIFRKEYAAVKAIRAWTYLQLVTTYGKVPFVLEPITDMNSISKNYPMVGIQEICNYFLDQDGMQLMQFDPSDPDLNLPLPNYGNVTDNLSSRLFFFPTNIVLGDLALWAGRYYEAAKYYYAYIKNERSVNNVQKVYSIGTDQVQWGDNQWETVYPYYTSGSAWHNYIYGAAKEAYMNGNKRTEWITVIPMDSTYNGTRTDLQEYFNSTSVNNGLFELQPSQALKDISADQTYCYIDPKGTTLQEPQYAPKSVVVPNASGDLRLSMLYHTELMEYQNQTITGQVILKYSGIRNVRIYRAQLVYLRLAEALNLAGYPLFAYHILATGINDNIIENYIMPEYPGSTLADDFKFRTSTSTENEGYQLWTPWNNGNTLGIHSRGSGFCGQKMKNMTMPDPYNPGGFINVPVVVNANEYYQPPTGTLDEQIKDMEARILDEGALEFAFEGTRYYDLLRAALRNNDVNFIQQKISKRATPANVDLTNKQNWFLHWKDQIGL